MQVVQTSVADGSEIIDGENYPSFPIVPLWANREHQSELIGLREKIDGYDLIQSGFANDLDDASQIYWTIQNAGGMDDIDLAKFIQHMKTVKAAVMDDDGAKAEAHTLDIPYQARQVGLQDLRDSLYRDAMALDTDKISAGQVTATAIESSYENLELKCDGYEYCVTESINALLALIGVEDSPTYHRRKTTNQPEVTNMILAAGEYLDDETILKHLPFLNIDEIDEILMRKNREEADRFINVEEVENNGQGENTNE
jgi:SPP1 family phage portal protein